MRIQGMKVHEAEPAGRASNSRSEACFSVTCDVMSFNAKRYIVPWTKHQTSCSSERCIARAPLCKVPRSEDSAQPAGEQYLLEAGCLEAPSPICG